MSTGMHGRPPTALQLQIRDYIGKNPGAHYKQILEHLGRANGAVAYSLQELERRSMVRHEERGRFTRFYPVGARPQPGPSYADAARSTSGSSRMSSMT